MARTIPVRLDSRNFDSKGEASEFFKQMLNRYRPGDRVSDVDAIDLAALLKLHTEYPQKGGRGIEHFEVMAAEFGTQCFRILRVDGSSEDFSYKHCISPKKD